MHHGCYSRGSAATPAHAQFIDALTGHHIWAERFDRNWADVFSAQDEITESIVSALALKLTEEERARVARRYTEDLVAYDLFLQAQALFFRSNQTDNEQAQTLYGWAIERDRNFARAYAALATSHIFDVRHGWSNDPGESTRQALEYALKAVELDDKLPHAHVMLGQVHVIGRHSDAAMAEAERAIHLDRNFADAYALLAVIYSATGRAQQAIPEIDKAMRLNPHPPGIYHFILGRALFFMRRYTEAADVLQRA